MAAFDEVFKRLVDHHTLGPNESAFLLEQGITTIEKMAILATSEADVKAEILDPMVSAGVEFKKLEQKTAVKLLWVACKKAAKSEGDIEVAGDSADAPLPKEVKDNIDALWSERHGFVLPDDWLLVSTLQGKMWRAMNQDKPKIDSILVEGLRPLSNTDKALGHQLAIVPGKPVETQSVIADGLKKPIEIYIRTRAWFTTMAYVSIKKPNWFDFQTALFASDKILHFVTQTFRGGQCAPSGFYIEAWAATIHYFSEHVRVSKESLKDTVLNTGAWEHRWTSYSPPPAGNSSSEGRSSGPDVPTEVQKEMARLKEEVKRWQSTADRYRIDADNLRKGEWWLQGRWQVQ